LSGEETVALAWNVSQACKRTETKISCGLSRVYSLHWIGVDRLGWKRRQSDRRDLRSRSL